MSKLPELVGFRHDKYLIKLSDRKSFVDVPQHLDRQPNPHREPGLLLRSKPASKTHFI